MGTWNTLLKGNDTFLDVYENFFLAYNEGGDPKNISLEIKNDFNSYFNDSDDRHNALFALALSQWETKSQDSEILNEVKRIIDFDLDIKLWKELGADEKQLTERKLILQKFLSEISKVKEKPKRRKRRPFTFSFDNQIKKVAPDGLKSFEMGDSIVNGEYTSTDASITWHGGGGGLFSFNGQGKKIEAKWIDSKHLEIRHEKNIHFDQKREWSGFYDDEVSINYIEMD